MSRQIPVKSTLNISDKEISDRAAMEGKMLFTSYRDQECAFLIQRNRLTAVSVLPEKASRLGAIYIGQIKNIARSIDACFVEIADGEICFLPLKKALYPYLLNRPYNGKLAEGDTLLVQVERDAQKAKQASVTAHISLSNDYFVLAMGQTQINYSTRLEKEQKDRLRKRVSYLFTERVIARNNRLIQDWDSLLSISSAKQLKADSISTDLLSLPPTGCIVRTRAANPGTDSSAPTGTVNPGTDSSAPTGTVNPGTDSSAPGTTAEDAAGTELMRQFFALTEEYARLLHTAKYRSCFSCLREAPCAVETVLQGLASEQEYQEIVTDDPGLYQNLLKYCNSHPDAKPLRLYQDDMLPLPRLYSIESKMETALERRVWLKSGGYLVIEPTEALTVIDVNSGKYESGRGTGETALTINLEAAREVALQLRLRNMSGIIIVDFINMAQDTDKKQVMDLLKQLTSTDRVKTTVVDMTPLGLVEITRKKISKPLREQFR